MESEPPTETAQIGESDMCEFCRQRKDENTIYGKDIKINQCASATDLSYAKIIKNVNDEKAGIIIFKQCKACGYFDINYCPMCGRKLCDETETPIEHFLKSEMERSKLRMNAYAECFDGVHVDNDTRKKLLEGHIRFCKNALKQCMDV